MTDKPDPFLQLIAASVEVLAIFDDNPDLYLTHGGTWETLNNAVNEAVETLLTKIEPKTAGYNPMNRSGNL